MPLSTSNQMHFAKDWVWIEICRPSGLCLNFTKKCGSGALVFLGLHGSLYTDFEPFFPVKVALK